MNFLQTILAAVFWISAAGIFYSYGLYAAIIRIASTIFGRSQDPQLLSDDQLPTVSLVICAHNEQDILEKRIQNALASDYPKDKLEIVIASDGSKDQTCQIVRQFANQGVRLIEFIENRGKATALNQSIPQLRSSLVVLSDANTMFQPQAIRTLVRWMGDPKIIAVCGKLLLTDPATGKNADSMYWKYETFLKQCEGKLGALLGSNGAIYAIRREQFVPIPAVTMIDDFVIPLVARIHFGGKIVYDEQAIATELTPEDLTSEFNRRARIGAGGFQAMNVLWPLLSPSRGWIAFTFVSHKILRWFCPWMMIFALAANVLLLNHPFYRWTLALQMVFYLCSAISAILPGGNRIVKPFRLAAMFTGMNAALLVGFFRWLGGSHRPVWAPTTRTAETKSAAQTPKTPLIQPLESRKFLSSYVVSPTGNDGAAGTADAPFATLQQAANVVQPGDSVSVLAGHYAGFQIRTSGAAGNPIIFAAEAGTIINAQNPSTPDGINLEGASYVTVEGFTLQSIPRAAIRSVQNIGARILDNQIEDSGSWGVLTGFSEDVDIEGNTISGSVKQHGIYVGNSADNPIIRDNTVFDNNQSGIQINSDASQGGDGIITGALIEDNIVYGNGIAGGAAINLDGVQDSVIQDNLLFDNHGTGIAVYKQDGAASPKNDVFVNNTVVMAADARWAVSVSNGASGIYFGNDVLLTLSNRRGVFCVSADSIAGFTSDFNAVSNRFSEDFGDSNLSLREWRDQTNQDANSILATPDGLFADYAKHDFHIASNSPAQDGGSPLHLPKKDLEGKPAANPAHPAIGAYQKSKPQVGAGLRGWSGNGGGFSMKNWPILAGIGAAALFVGAVWSARRRNAGRWILPYFARSLKPRLQKSRDIHLLLCIADHYEPQNGDVDHDRAMQRVLRWTQTYPIRFSKFCDSDGKPPQHSFFYPLEQFDDEEMAALANLCHSGFGEVEVHLHHDHDTAENLRTRLSRYTQMLADRYGLLATRRSDGRLMYGFIHGNWALDNSRPDGRWCGVDTELEVLQQTGCYADFTLPSAPNPTQISKINSIYYARENGRPRSHERGIDVGKGKRPDDALMMIQGPLMLNWRNRKWGIFPRIENSCLQANQSPNATRLNLWLRAAVQVPQRPDWYFVKLHTHGAPEANAQILLGEEMVNFHTLLAKRSMFDPHFHYHYVTARQMYNLARAAEAGWTGSVDEARDFELTFNGASARWSADLETTQSRTA